MKYSKLWVNLVRPAISGNAGVHVNTIKWGHVIISISESRQVTALCATPRF